MNYRIIFFLIISFCVETNIFSQSSILWQSNFGGSNVDMGKDICITNDGGYIVVGTTLSANGDIDYNHGDNDCWVIKFNKNKEIEWQRTYGGSLSDDGVSIKQTKDSGYILLASSLSNNGDVSGHHGVGFLRNDYWVAKLDHTGIIQWQKSLGGDGVEFAKSVDITDDGGYIIAGWTDSNSGDVVGNHGGNDGWLVKLDSTGHVNWKRCFGGTGNDILNAVMQTRDGKYVVAGASSSADGDATENKGEFDLWVIRLNNNGTILSQKTFGGSLDDMAFAIDTTTDGGFVVAGRSGSSDKDVHVNKGNEDYWVLRLSKDLSLKWQRSFGGNGNDNAYSVQQTKDGSYIIAGYTDSFTGDVTDNHNKLTQDAWVIKLDKAGNLSWKKCYGGSGSEQASSIKETSDGQYFLAAFASSSNGDLTGNKGNYDYWIFELNNDVVLSSKLQDFVLQRINTNIVCTWNSVNEVNVKEYVVEHSKDASTFYPVGILKAKNNYYNTYYFVDSIYLNGFNYYRLKIVDNNDAFSYSNILKLENDIKNISLKIYPNPSSKYLVVQHPSITTQSFIRIYNVNGALVRKLNVPGSETQTIVQVAGLSKGVYKIIWGDDKQSLTGTFIVAQ